MTSDDAPSATDAATPSRLADAVSIASDFGAVWALVAALQVLTGRSTTRDAARRLCAAGVTSLVLTRWLKHRFAVPRGDAVAPTSLARAPSSDRFPSGHTLAAFAAALVVPQRPLGRGLAVAFASLVAWARVRVGHHRPVDVVAGAAAGTLAGGALSVALAALDAR